MTTDATWFGLDRRGWGPPALILGCMLAILALYWQSFGSMVAMWSLANYEYGWFVFPISVVMLWHIRFRLAAVKIVPSGVGTLALAATVVVWVMAKAVNVQVIELFAATILVPTLVWALGGFRLFYAALFPLLFLAASVPVGEAIIPALMRSTADIATWLLDQVGVPAYRENMFLTLPGGQFEVADICSGLRYLLAGSVVAMLFAYWNYRSFTKRVIFVLGVAGGFILLNGIRAFIVMYVASATDMRVFAGRDHVIFGQVLFLLFAILLMYIGSRFADPDEAHPDVVESPGAEWRPALSVLAAAILAFGPAGQYLRSGGDAGQASLPYASVGLSACDEQAAWRPDWKPRFHLPDRQASTSWRCAGATVSLYQAVYLEQEQGKELVSSANEVWPYDWRRWVTTGKRTVLFAEGERPAVEIYRNSPAGTTLVWYWYEIDGRATTSTFHAKFLEGTNALRLHEASAAIVVLIAEGSSDRAELVRALTIAAAALP